MGLYVVSYPHFAEADRQWIEGIRRQYDPQAERLAAHITLVFGVTGVDVATAASHLREVARVTSRFEINLGEAVTRPGMTDTLTYAYLVPIGGAEMLHFLHRELSQGPFSDRQSLPFEPHVTLGRSQYPDAMEKLVGCLNRQRFVVPAAIQDLELLEANSVEVTTLASAKLC